MSKLKIHISRKVEAKGDEKFRVSVAIHDFISRRVELCAKQMGMTRASLCSEIIEGGIADVEEALGLKIKDENGEFTEYGKAVLEGYGLEVPPAYEESEVTK